MQIKTIISSFFCISRRQHVKLLPLGAKGYCMIFACVVKLSCAFLITYYFLSNYFKFKYKLK